MRSQARSQRRSWAPIAVRMGSNSLCVGRNGDGDHGEDGGGSEDGDDWHGDGAGDGDCDDENDDDGDGDDWHGDDWHSTILDSPYVALDQGRMQL